MKKNKAKAPKQPESVVVDRTPLREKLWTDLSVAITNAGQHGLPRVVVIEDLLRQANNLAEIAKPKATT
jgi:hypothetical protein